MTQEELEKRTHDLFFNMLEEIARATSEMTVGDYDCGKLYIPSFKYEPSFEFNEEDVELIKHIASKEDWESAKTLADWFENAEEEE